MELGTALGKMVFMKDAQEKVNFLRENSLLSSYVEHLRGGIQPLVFNEPFNLSEESQLNKGVNTIINSPSAITKNENTGPADQLFIETMHKLLYFNHNPGSVIETLDGHGLTDVYFEYLRDGKQLVVFDKVVDLETDPLKINSFKDTVETSKGKNTDEVTREETPEETLKNSPTKISLSDHRERVDYILHELGNINVMTKDNYLSLMDVSDPVFLGLLMFVSPAKAEEVYGTQMTKGASSDEKVLGLLEEIKAETLSITNKDFLEKVIQYFLIGKVANTKIRKKIVSYISSGLLQAILDESDGDIDSINDSDLGPFKHIKESNIEDLKKGPTKKKPGLSRGMR